MIRTIFTGNAAFTSPLPAWSDASSLSAAVVTSVSPMVSVSVWSSVFPSSDEGSAASALSSDGSSAAVVSAPPAASAAASASAPAFVIRYADPIFLSL